MWLNFKFHAEEERYRERQRKIGFKFTDSTLTPLVVQCAGIRGHSVPLGVINEIFDIVTPDIC